MLQIARTWEKKIGGTKILLNKEIRGQNGEILKSADGRVIRPDVQFWYRGKLHVYEVWNTGDKQGRKELIKNLARHHKISVEYKDVTID